MGVGFVCCTVCDVQVCRKKQKSVFSLCRGRERSKSADVRTRPTLTTQGDTGPSQYSRHPPPTMHHASLRKPPEAPHSAWPTLPHPAPRRPAAGRKRGGARARQRHLHRSTACVGAPPGSRSRSRARWSLAVAMARMQRRSELRPVSHNKRGRGRGSVRHGLRGRRAHVRRAVQDDRRTSGGGGTPLPAGRRAHLRDLVG